MHTEIQLKLPQQKELSYTEVFGAALPVYEDEYVAENDFECDFTIERSYFKRNGGGSSPISLCSDESQSRLDERDFCRDDWEWLQEYGDISAAFNEKGELYECVDINEICCNLGVSFVPSVESYNGPTLSELNSGAMSPVINPDMERLHFVALKTDHEAIDTLENAYSKQRGYIRGPWINHPLRTAPWLSANIRSSNNVMVNLPVTNSGTADFNVQETPLYKNHTVKDENQLDKYPEQINHPNLVQVKLENVEDKENYVAGGEEIITQYQDGGHHEEEDDEDYQSEKSSDNESHEQINSDSDMEEEEDDNYDTDNDEYDEVYYQKTRNNRERHSGKGRRKDTEDGIPNPKRLLDIGRQLEKLNSTISDLKPVHQLPLQIRNQTRREKNKLASRACRLKKKATHEANKIKLQGLAMEKERLLCNIRDIKRFLVKSMNCGQGKRAKYEKYFELENLLSGFQVAGNLHKFVESVLKSATVGASIDCSNMF